MPGLLNEINTFSDYLVFVDESGDHGLDKIDAQYPVFVLLFVIIKKQDYISQICPSVQRFKMKFWGHDEVVLHEHDMRKPVGDFKFLLEPNIRAVFIEELNELISQLPLTIIAVVIDKSQMRMKYADPRSPYHYGMEVGLERVWMHLNDLGQTDKTTSIVVERRGATEDSDLELAFRRVCAGANKLGKSFPFQIVMIPKSANSIGLQAADLMARSIGIHFLRPDQSNRAYEIIKNKFRKSPSGEIKGWGLKHLP